MVVISTVIGAALFWAAGYFLSRGRTPETATIFERDAARGRVRELEVEVESLREERTGAGPPDASVRIAQLEQQVQNPPAMKEAKARIATLERELQSAQSPAPLNEAKARIAALERDAQGLREAAKEIARLKAELSRTTTEIDRLESASAGERTQVIIPEAPARADRALEEANEKLKREVANLQAELRTLRDEEAATSQRDVGSSKEIERLQGDKTRLEAELSRAERRVQDLQKAADASGDRLSQFEHELREVHDQANTALAAKVTAHQAELKLADERLGLLRAELGEAREEVAALKVQSDEVARLSSDLQAATTEVQRLKALEFASAGRVWKPAPTDLPVEPTGDHIGDSLQAMVERAMSGGASSVAVSDGMGLVVAGAGEHSESLAAVGALFIELTGRTTRILPLQGLARAQLEDANGVTVAVQGFSGGGSMLLVTLGVRRSLLGSSVGTVAPAPPARPS